MIDEPVRGRGQSSHLPFREIQVYGDFVPPQSGQIVVMGEFCLQFSNLLFGERRPLLPWLAAHIRFVIPILGLLKEKTRMEWKKTFPMSETLTKTFEEQHQQNSL